MLLKPCLTATAEVARKRNAVRDDWPSGQEQLLRDTRNSEETSTDNRNKTSAIKWFSLVPNELTLLSVTMLSKDKIRLNTHSHSHLQQIRTTVPAAFHI